MPTKKTFVILCFGTFAHNCFDKMTFSKTKKKIYSTGDILFRVDPSWQERLNISTELPPLQVYPFFLKIKDTQLHEPFWE